MSPGDGSPASSLGLASFLLVVLPLLSLATLLLERSGPIRLRHWGLSVTQVVVMSYLGAALLGGIGLLVMTIPQQLAVILSGVTLLCLAGAAVALTRLNVSSGVPGLNSESASRSAERTGVL